MVSLFPSIIPDSDEPFVDDSYGKEELERKEWKELQGLAKEVESDEINGHSSREEIIEFLEGHERL